MIYGVSEMIEKKVPRDIAKYEAKLIGPLTTRQVLFGLAGILAGLGAFFLTKDRLGDAALFLAIVAAAPFMLCGFYKPYNQPFEKFAASVITTIFIAPSVRKYKSENEIIKPKGKGKKSSYKSSDPNCRKI